MVTLTGRPSTKGVGHMGQRMRDHAPVFQWATGETLHPGTFNVEVSLPVLAIKHFAIAGAQIGEPEQDLWFEVCRVNGIWAYRIRPVNVIDGTGGHGDKIIEIACSTQLGNHPLIAGHPIVIELFR